MKRQSGWVHFESGGTTLKAYLAQPDGKGPFPAIVVFQEIFGINSHVRSVVNRLAEAGYIALAPALFQRTAPDLDIGYSTKDVAVGRSHKDKTTAAQLLADTRASFDFLKTLGRAKKQHFGCIGFCFGGHVAFLAATLPEMEVTASFYGAGIAVTTPGGGPASLTRVKEIKGTLYAFFGEKDALIPKDQVDRIETELATSGLRHRVFRYPTGHGFFCDQREDFNAEYAEKAWKEVLGLFKKLG